MNLLLRLMAPALMMVSLGACAHPQGPVAEDPAARAAVLDYYAQLRRAVTQRDALALKGLYEESFTHTHGSGKVDGRDARIVSLMTAEPTVEMREDHDIVLEPYDGRVVIVRGKGPILNVKENQLYPFRWVQVLLKRDGRWRMAVSQATRLPDAPTPNPDRK